MEVKLSDVIISDRFQKTKCSVEKIDIAVAYVREHNTISKPIVLDKHNVLVDGYSRYLAAKYVGLTEIPVEYMGVEAVYGKFYGNDKMFCWLNPKGIAVKKGDFLLVENRNGFSVVKAEEIGKTDTLEHKAVIDNLSNILPLNELLMAMCEYVGLEVCNNDFDWLVDGERYLFYRGDDKGYFVMNEEQKKVFDACRTILELFTRNEEKKNV